MKKKWKKYKKVISGFFEIVNMPFLNIAFKLEGATHEEFEIISESEASQSDHESEILEECDEEKANSTGILH